MKEDYIPVFLFECNGVKTYVKRSIGYSGIASLALSQGGFPLQDMTILSIYSWIHDKKNYINGNFKIWAGFDYTENSPYKIDVTCLIFC